MLAFVKTPVFRYILQYGNLKMLSFVQTHYFAHHQTRFNFRMLNTALSASGLYGRVLPCPRPAREGLRMPKGTSQTRKSRFPPKEALLFATCQYIQHVVQWESAEKKGNPTQMLHLRRASWRGDDAGARAELHRRRCAAHDVVACRMYTIYISQYATLPRRAAERKGWRARGDSHFLPLSSET
jgi:hypothetical protein